MLVLGICGGIASGKSKACQILVSHPDITNCILGYVDADQLAHSLYDNNSSSSSVLLEQILHEFGPTVFVFNNSTSSNLQLDRKALGNIVFSNPERMSVSLKKEIYFFLTISQYLPSFSLYFISFPFLL